MFEIPKQFSDAMNTRTVTVIYNLMQGKQNAFLRAMDEVSIFRLKKNLLDGTLPVYNLKLSRNDLEHFDNISGIAKRVGYMDARDNTWRSATIDFENERYDVKVKLHGDLSLHWAERLKSYKIKTAKDSYINHLRRFNFILFEYRLLRPTITNILAKELGLMDIKGDIVVLKINGLVQGLYYMEEGLDNNFLEKNQCSNCEVIEITDNWIDDHPYTDEGSFLAPYGVLYSSAHYTAFDYEISNIDLEKSDIDKNKVLYSTNNLFQAIKQEDADTLLNYFDIDYLASFDALRVLVADPHFVTGDNIRMAYSATNSKFYPIPKNEELIQLTLERGGFEHALHFYFGRHVDPFYQLIQNDELRQLRNKKLYDYILNNKDRVINEINSLVERYLPYASSYKIQIYSKRYFRYLLKGSADSIEYNMNLVKAVLEYSKSYINVIQKDNIVKFEIIPDSISQIRFDQLKIRLSDGEGYSGNIKFGYRDEGNNSVVESGYVADESSVLDLTEFAGQFYFSAGLDEDLYPRKRTYLIEVVFEDADKVIVDGVDVKMTNDITNQTIKEEDIYIQIADGNDYYHDFIYLSFEEFVRRYPNFDWRDEGGKLILSAGRYRLDRDLIIPKSFDFVINEGVEISIAENKSIVSFAPVDILGTERNPVVIKAQFRDRPFGTFGIVGSRSTINWLDLSGGSEKYVNGIYFSGALSIYDAGEVKIENSKIHGNYADDGLNIKNADVFIIGSRFYDNSVDQFDCDFCRGIIADSEFVAADSDEVDGDGLDLSGSEIIVRRSEFQKFRDKGVSIGEDTLALLYENNLVNNPGSSVAVKDSSHVFFIDNIFRNNKKAITSYQKKQMFGGGFSYLYGNTFESNEKDYELDKKSKIYNIKLTEDNYNEIVEEIEQQDIDKLFARLERILESQRRG